jgi:hypothetical protein
MLFLAGDATGTSFSLKSGKVESSILSLTTSPERDVHNSEQRKHESWRWAADTGYLPVLVR